MSPGRHVVPLDDPEVGWYVEDGAVDVFGTKPDAGWRPLYKASAGSIVVGVPTGRRGVTVHARQHPQSRLREVRFDDPDLDLDALERGLAAFIASLRRDIPPREFTALDAGARLDVAAPSTVRTTGLLWVNASGAGVRLLGRELSKPVNGKSPVLVGADDYLEVEIATSLSARTTADLAEAGELGAALAAVQQFAIATLAVRMARLEQAESTLVVERHERSKELTTEVDREFAALLTPDAGPHLAARARTPLQAAVQLACNELGVVPAEGETLDEMTQGVDVYSRQVELSGLWWKRDLGPLVGFMRPEDAESAEEPQPVALLRRRRGYVVVDSTDGSECSLGTEERSRLDGAAIMFHRTLPAGSVSPLGLMRFGLQGTAGDVRVVALTTVLIGALGLLIPIMTGLILGELIPSGRRSQIEQLSLLLLASALVGLILAVAQAFGSVRLESRLEGAIQPAVWARLTALPGSLLRRYSTGQLATMILTPIEARQALAPIWIRTLFAAVVAVVNLGLIFFYDLRLGLLTLALLTVASGVAALTLRAQIGYEQEGYVLSKELNSRAFQLIGHVSKLRVAAAEDRAFVFWGRLFAARRRTVFASRSIQNRFATFNGLLLIVGLIGAFVIAGALSDVGVTAFVSFNVAFAQVIASYVLIATTLSAALPLAPPLGELAEFMRVPTEADAGGEDPGDLRGEIELVGVSHSYDPDGPIILDDVSISVKPGEFVAIVGPSGSGKSTVLRVMLGFEQPSAGSVLYDERELASLDISAVRRRCGVVLQDGQLLAGDILGNIIGTGNFTVDDAWDAAAQVGLADDIKAMPMGMYTLIQAGGGALSGGQRQRIMLARAIVSRPRIVMLDEATSALDNTTQQVVTESMRKLNATRIVIAHRLSTIVDADRIIVLEGGRIVQEGTSKELLAVPGTFRTLAQRQML